MKNNEIKEKVKCYIKFNLFNFVKWGKNDKQNIT